MIADNKWLVSFEVENQMSLNEVLYRLETILKITDDMDAETNYFTSIPLFLYDRKAIKFAYEIIKKMTEVEE